VLCISCIDGEQSKVEGFDVDSAGWKAKVTRGNTVTKRHDVAFTPILSQAKLIPLAQASKSHLFTCQLYLDPGSSIIEIQVSTAVLPPLPHRRHLPRTKIYPITSRCPAQGGQRTPRSFPSPVWCRTVLVCPIWGPGAVWAMGDSSS